MNHAVASLPPKCEAWTDWVSSSNPQPSPDQVWAFGERTNRWNLPLYMLLKSINKKKTSFLPVENINSWSNRDYVQRTNRQYIIKHHSKTHRILSAPLGWGIHSLIAREATINTSSTYLERNHFTVIHQPVKEVYTFCGSMHHIQMHYHVAIWGF